jgi:AcrR family transcriptional regulator
LSVSTRQIADAAGVAEGTIFGVFKDKASLIDAAIATAFEPTPVVRALGEVDPHADLRARMTAAAEILRARVVEQGPLLHVLRSLAMQGGRSIRVDLFASRHLIVTALTALIEPDAALLRRSPATTARLLQALTMQPRDGFIGMEPLDSAEVVSLLLDGLLVRDDPPPDTRTDSRESSLAHPTAQDVPASI